MSETPFLSLASLSEQLSSTTKRTELRGLVADFLRALEGREIGVGARLLIGRVFAQSDARTLGTSGQTIGKLVRELIGSVQDDERAALAKAADAGDIIEILFESGRRSERLPPLGEDRLSLMAVQAALDEIAAAEGEGARSRKEALIKQLLSACSPLEAKILTRIVLGETRHGVKEGLLLDAIAKAAGVKAADVRRASMFLGDMGQTAQIAIQSGLEGLRAVGMTLFQPVQPMLAATADSLDDAFEANRGQIALEHKLDGARVQLHKKGEVVKAFSRRLSDVTHSMPEVIELVRSELAADEAVLDGEAIAVDEQGRPIPFQDVMRRFGRVHEVEGLAAEMPLELHLFDALHIDGRLLIDRPYTDRWDELTRVAGRVKCVPRLVPQSVAEAEAFFESALEAGHEGLVIKKLDSPYTPGVRGKSWLKLKHVHSLDLVILAAEWGHGRRHGWLSNYHLGVRDEGSGRFLNVGKTFKGLTDSEFQQVTERLLSLKTDEEPGIVYVKPETVVEVAFNDIQRSPHYESGMALRFARIARFRDDKQPDEADTLATMQRLYQNQFQRKGGGG